MAPQKGENPVPAGLNADQITNTQILPPAQKIDKVAMPVGSDDA
jgi:hypothetical protein